MNCPGVMSPPQSWIYVLLSHITLWIMLFGESEQGLHEERLINDIFDKHKINYNKFARPVQNEQEALEVKFGISLQQIVDVDEKNEMLHTNMWLNYEWMDYKLQWNEEEYNNVKSIRLPSSSIWTPDILMYNSADEDIDSKFPTNIVVYSSGLCSWVPLGLYISSCSINIRWFPFDDQYCKMKFGSWTYDGSKINLTARADKIDLSTYQESGEWKLLEVPAIRSIFKYECCVEEYIDVTFHMHLRRRSLYYGFNLIIPCALISALSLLIFCMPPDAGEKVGLGITILLSLSVFQLIVAESVPATSLAVPLLGVYFACIMIMCTISVIMTVLVLNFHHRSPEMNHMSPWVRRVVCEWLAWLLRMSRPGRDLSRQFLIKKARMRQLESVRPPSLSLISNIKDVDNAIPLNSDFNNYNNFNNTDTYHTMIENGNSSGFKTELLSILNELRFITHKMKVDSEADDETNDWKFAAMVIDRLCLWIFSAFLVITTIAIFISAPNLVIKRDVN